MNRARDEREAGTFRLGAALPNLPAVAKKVRRAKRRHTCTCPTTGVGRARVQRHNPRCPVHGRYARMMAERR